jgi:hypothetical protein
MFLGICHWQKSLGLGTLGYQYIVYKHDDQNKETNYLARNPTKTSNFKLPQLLSYENFQTNLSLLHFSTTKT